MVADLGASSRPDGADRGHMLIRPCFVFWAFRILRFAKYGESQEICSWGAKTEIAFGTEMDAQDAAQSYLGVRLQGVTSGWSCP